MSAALKTHPALTPQQLIEQMISGSETHICQPLGWMYDEEIQSAQLLSQKSETFFSHPATAILWPKEISSRNEQSSLLLNRNFCSSDEKNGLLDEMKTIVNGISRSSTLVDEVIAVTDEFVTNALYNAPYVDPVTFVNQRINRLTTKVKLDHGKQARLFAAQDGKRLLIGVEDPYGSLDVKSYLNRIHKCYSSVKDSINFGEGGAGIGSYIIFNTGSSLYYGVKPGEKTLLVCVVPIKVSRRQREDLPKHLHWIK